MPSLFVAPQHASRRELDACGQIVSLSPTLAYVGLSEWADLMFRADRADRRPVCYLR